MSSFRHSYVNFRNKGEIMASLIFSAHGELRIPYMEEVLLGTSTPLSVFVSALSTPTEAVLTQVDRDCAHWSQL